MSTAKNRCTVPGTDRQVHVTRDGVELERKYIYLTSALWQALYATSAGFNLSVSEFIARTITNAALSAEPKGLKHDKPNHNI